MELSYTTGSVFGAVISAATVFKSRTAGSTLLLSDDFSWCFFQSDTRDGPKDNHK